MVKRRRLLTVLTVSEVGAGGATVLVMVMAALCHSERTPTPFTARARTWYCARSTTGPM